MIKVKTVASYLSELLNDEISERSLAVDTSGDVLLEGLLYLRDARVLLHHQEIGFPVLVELTDPPEQESGARVLVTDNGDQFPASSHSEVSVDQTERRGTGAYLRSS